MTLVVIAEELPYETRKLLCEVCAYWYGLLYVKAVRLKRNYKTMQTYYDINVSKNGKHLFATHERSVNTISDLRKVAPIIKEKFPESEGYAVSITYYSCKGEWVDENGIAITGN